MKLFKVYIYESDGVERTLIIFDYYGNSGTPLYGYPLIMDSFVFPEKKLIFSLKLTRFIQIPVNNGTWETLLWDTLLCPELKTLISVVNPALQTLVICTLSIE